MINKKFVFILEDRGILYINGPDSKEFLQNLITNDIYKVNDENSCYASLLNPQGKFLHDFIIVKHKNGFFLDCEKNIADELYNKIVSYKLRSKIDVLNLSNEFIVAAFSYSKFLEFEGAQDSPGFTTKFREDPVFLDPRNKELGGRLIINLEKLYLSLKKLHLKSENPEMYYDYSFDLGIPQLETNKLKEKLFGIECNFEELNAIDFKKGCYIGQENTSRIKLKNKLNKRLLPFRIKRGSLNKCDTITYNKNEIGKVLISNKYNFGVVKLNNNIFSFDRTFNCGEAEIKFFKPKWLNL
ncbi:MAG: YgfZ/GcvT domain-containing protein [Candidatus Pelagibacter sp.]